jgi:Ca2+-binding RTX toxin-like protein
VGDDLRVRYVPGAGSARTDRFTYEVCGSSACGTAEVTVTIEPPECAGVPATRWGTSDPDEIDGTNGDDVIATFGGGDTVRSGRGADVVCAGNGADTIALGGGSDRGLGQGGADEITGGGGRDIADGGGGTDACTAEVRRRCE